MSPAPVITVDGPSGSGKGTICRRVATALGFHLLDSGALYRLTGLAGSRAGLDPADEAGHAALALRMGLGFGVDEAGGERILLDGEVVTDRIRTEQAGNLASIVARYPAVRSALLERQRAFAKPPGLVADGRDMGPVVFPDAGLKIFLTASAEERAHRRARQQTAGGLAVDTESVHAAMQRRDEIDSTRVNSPLAAAGDAVLLDTTTLTFDEVVERIVELAQEREA